MKDNLLDNLVLNIPVFDLIAVGDLVAEKLGEKWEVDFYNRYSEFVNFYQKRKGTHPLDTFLNSLIESVNPKATVMILFDEPDRWN